MQKSATKRPIREGEEEFSLREIVAPLFRRKKLLIVSLIAAFVLLTPALLLLLYKFKSEMAILVNRERIDSLVSTGVPNQTITEPVPMTEEDINSEAELLMSQEILEKVVRANNLQASKPSFLDAILPPDDEAHRVASAVNRLAHKIKVRPSTKANLIDISYSSGDPVKAHAVLASLATFYLEKHAEVHRPQGSSQFFAAETARYKRALDDSEARLREFVKTPGASSPDLQRTDLDLQLAAAIGQVHITEAAVAAAAKRVETDQEQLKSTPQRSTTQTTSAPADLLLQQLGTALLAAETKRTQLLSKYDANYPLVVEADQELAETKAAFERAQQAKYVTENSNADATYELLRADLAKSQSDLAAARASLAANKAGVASMQAQMAQLAEKGLDQADLVREQKADETNYLLYFAKREQERTTDALDKTNIENVAIAIPPSTPVLPVMSPFMVVMVSLVGALFLSLGLVYSVDYFDSSFHTPAEVADSLGIPVVLTMSKKSA